MENEIDADNDYFIFVDLKGEVNQRPECYIVPSAYVKNYAEKIFKARKTVPTATGKQHDPNNPYQKISNIRKTGTRTRQMGSGRTSGFQR